MIFQGLIYLVVFLIFIYYITVVLHLFGLKIFSCEDILFGRALIPLYYWFAKEEKIPEVEANLSFEEQLKNAEEAVKKAEEVVEKLTSESYQESSKARAVLTKARRVHKKALAALELLKKTKF